MPARAFAFQGAGGLHRDVPPAKKPVPADSSACARISEDDLRNLWLSVTRTRFEPESDEKPAIQYFNRPSRG